MECRISIQSTESMSPLNKKNASLVYFRSACISLHQLHNIMHHSSSQPTRVSFNYDDWNCIMCRVYVEGVSKVSRRITVAGQFTVPSDSISILLAHIELSRANMDEREKVGNGKKIREELFFSNEIWLRLIDSTVNSVIMAGLSSSVSAKKVDRLEQFFHFTVTLKFTWEVLFLSCVVSESDFRDWMESHTQYHRIKSSQ